MNEKLITSTTGGNDQPGELEGRLREKAKTDRQINNFLRLLMTITEAKTHSIETIDQLLISLRQQNILEIGPGDTTEILKLLINDFRFDPNKLHAIGRFMKINPNNYIPGRYIGGKIEELDGAWPKEHFGLIFGFHVLGDLLIRPTVQLAEQFYDLITPEGLLALSSVDCSNPEPIKQRFGQPIAAYHPLGLLIFSKGSQ